MIAALRLGLRLAGGGAATGSSRLRSAMVAVAAAVGAVLMLGVVAIAHSETGRSDHGLVSSHGMSLLLATVVVTVALPVLVLAATAGRLAAAMRDRRLANLRLLGMTAARTRVVAAVETGVAAVAGTLVGWGLFLLARPALVAWHPVGRHWVLDTLTPTPAGYAVVLLAVPVAVTLASASPRTGSGQTPLAVARRADTRRPPLWRLAPLLLGIALAAYVLVTADPRGDNDGLVPTMFGAIVALGLGTLLVVPSFVRLVADALVRRRSSPASVIAGRRLQDQPAATTRIVSGLLIGLFLVTGARAVVVAFEQTPQYQSAARMQSTGQVASAWISTTDADAAREELADLRFLRATATFPQLTAASCREEDPTCVSAVVGTCADLTRIFGPLPTCRDDAPARLWDPFGHKRDQIQLTSTRASGGPYAEAPTVVVPRPTYRLPRAVADAFQAELFLPRSTPGLAPLLTHTQADLLAVGRPGVDLGSALFAATDPAELHAVFSTPDTSYYDFVAGLRELVWAVAAVVLSIGLLAFAIGAVDRVTSRRAEVVSLQLTGVGPGLLRRTQWIEAALPLGAGVVLAVGLGALAGATYLAFGGEAHAIPWPQTLTLAGVSLGAAVGVAALTVVAASPRIRPELIRSE